jgi:hypothetical protein
MTRTYILGGDDGRTPVLEEDLHTWAVLSGLQDRRVALSRVELRPLPEPNEANEEGVWVTTWLKSAALDAFIEREDDGPRRAYVSTVFLGLDHHWMWDEGAGTTYEPHIFETLVFWDSTHYDGEMRRCGTWAGAELRHRRLVKLVALEMLNWDDGVAEWEDEHLDTWPDLDGETLLRHGPPGDPTQPDLPRTVLISGFTSLKKAYP